MALTFEQARAIPVTVQDAFTATLPLPLPTLFRHWYGPIPPINVTRRWTIHPRSALSTPALPVFGWLWRGYARRALEELSGLLVG